MENKIYIDMRTGKKVIVVKRTDDDVMVIIDEKVRHMSIDYMMENCKSHCE